MKNIKKECKICIVDDHLMSIQDFKDKFQGYNITTFLDSRKAAEVIKKEQFHVFIVDIYMPNIDGIELCRLIRESPINCDAYIIAYTCEGDEMKQIIIFREDFDDFIEKPVKPEMLKIKLSTLFNKKYRKTNNIKNQLVQIQHTYYLNGIKIPLTSTEFRIIQILASNQQEYYSTVDIIQKMSEIEINIKPPTVGVHIRNIKLKFYEAAPDIEYLKTLPQKGYFLNNLNVLNITTEKVARNQPEKETPKVEKEPVEQQPETIWQRIHKLTKIGIVKEMKTRQEKIERELCQLYLNRDLFEQFEKVAKEKNEDITKLIEDFMQHYYNVSMFSLEQNSKN